VRTSPFWLPSTAFSCKKHKPKTMSDLRDFKTYELTPKFKTYELTPKFQNL
jgi:hypothetical protein